MDDGGGLVATIFIVTAWAGLMAALAIYIVSLGMLPLAAVIVVAAVNLMCRCRDAVLVHRSEPSPAFLGDATAVGGRFLSQAISPMTRVPTLAAINAAELRLLQSKRNVRQSVDRTRSALRAAIARPSTLVLVAVAVGYFGIFGLAPASPRRQKRTEQHWTPQSERPAQPCANVRLDVWRTSAGLCTSAWRSRMEAEAGRASTPTCRALRPKAIPPQSATTEHDSPGPGQHGVG
jgi:hypothetical protein